MGEILKLTHRIDGRPRAGPAVFVHTNPADRQDLIIESPGANAALVLEAATLAKARLGAGDERARDLCERLAQATAANAEVFAGMIMRETGLTRTQALMDVAAAASALRRGAGAPTRRSAAGSLVGVITPFSAPLAPLSVALAGAIPSGGAVVWKPSPFAAASATRFLETLEEAGLPAGVMTLLLGDATAGEALCACPLLDDLHYTGRWRNAARVRKARAARKLTVHSGAMNGVIVLADADIDRAARSILSDSIFGGASCRRIARVIAHKAIADRLVARLARGAADLVVGDPRDARVDLGPMPHPTYAAAFGDLIDSGRHGRASVIVGPGLGAATGAFVRPTVVDHVAPASALDQEDIPGPLATIVRVDGFEEGLSVLRGVRALALAGLHTQSALHIEAFRSRVVSDETLINLSALDAGCRKIETSSDGHGAHPPPGRLTARGRMRGRSSAPGEKALNTVSAFAAS